MCFLKGLNIITANEIDRIDKDYEWNDVAIYT